MTDASLAMNNKNISSLPLPYFLKTALGEAGYKSTSDLDGVDANDLRIELSIALAQAEDIVRLVEGYRAGPSQHPPTQPPTQSRPTPYSPTKPLQSQTAAELLTKPLPRFSTFSNSIDDLISNFTPNQGVRRRYNGKGKEREGSITPGMALEISGPPGSGKTSVALGVMLSARMVEGDEAGEVLVIDTEGAFTPERILKAAQTVTRNTAHSPRTMLRGIHYMRIATQVQMIALMNTMDDWLEQHPKVNLIVIDTLSYHFRHPNTDKIDAFTRIRVLELVKHVIGKATTIHQCAVIVVNQLATKLQTVEGKPANFDSGDRAVLMPQLGDIWTTAKTIRVVLFRGGQDDGMRYAHASTSAGERRDVPWSCYDIDSDGLPRDLPEETEDNL